MDRRSSTRGFTLAELLIVVAIIAVLVAIAIPVFNSQLEKSREATDLANVRSAYAEVMTAAITEDKTAAYNGTAMYDAATGTYKAVVSPLAQKQDGWAISTPITIGGVTSGSDGGDNADKTWIGKPKASGSCTITYDPATAKVTIDWNGNSGGSGSGGSGDDAGSGGSPINNAVELPTDYSDGKTFQVEKGNIYKYKGNYYVAGTTPDSAFNQYYSVTPESENSGWLYIKLDSEALKNAKTSADLINGKAYFNIGDVYKSDDGNYYIRHYDNGDRPVDDLDTSSNWVKINYSAK